MPERYRYFEEREERLRARIGDYTILREQRDGVRLRITLRELRERVEAAPNGATHDGAVPNGAASVAASGPPIRASGPARAHDDREEVHR